MAVVKARWSQFTALCTKQFAAQRVCRYVFVRGNGLTGESVLMSVIFYFRNGVIGVVNI